MIHIEVVDSKKQWSDFIDLPWKIYEGDENWVPPLKIAVRELLDVEKNPFYKHAYLKAFLARKDGEYVGRIAVIINDRHNRYANEKTAFFGFFESINDQAVSDALFAEAKKIAKEWGMTTVRGPVNPSTNYECGLLVEGFNDSPNINMTYNPKYYGELFEKAGFSKAQDLFAYEVDQSKGFEDRIFAQAERLKQRGKLKVREINMKDFDAEVDRILEIYNDAWEDNWGFVPPDEEEFRHIAKDMKLVVDPKLLLIVERDGKPVAFGMALPDVNQVLKKNRKGKLLPFGIFKLLWNLKGPGRRKSISRCRILTLGILKKYQRFGIGPLLYAEYLKRGPSIGYPIGEASWILEDNTMMNKALLMMRAEKTKTYRLYDHPLV